jgi:hypothetical protein
VVSAGRGFLLTVELQLPEDLLGDRKQLSQLGCAVIGVFAKLDEIRGRHEILDMIPALILALEQQY